MTSLKIICILILAAFVGVFIYQNTEVMHLTFLFWSVSMSLSLIVGAAFFAGFIAGLILQFLRSRKKGPKQRLG